MRKKTQHQKLVEGDRVIINRDVMRWPALALTSAKAHGYGDPVVYVPAGTPATVKPIGGDSYLVYPDNLGGNSIHLHIASLDIVQEGNQQ